MASLSLSPPPQETFLHPTHTRMLHLFIQSYVRFSNNNILDLYMLSFLLGCILITKWIVTW